MPKLVNVKPRRLLPINRHALSIVKKAARCLTIRAAHGQNSRFYEGQFDVVLPGFGRRHELEETSKRSKRSSCKLVKTQELEANADQDRTSAEQGRADIARLAYRFDTAMGKVTETISSVPKT